MNRNRSRPYDRVRGRAMVAFIMKYPLYSVVTMRLKIHMMLTAKQMRAVDFNISDIVEQLLELTRRVIAHERQHAILAHRPRPWLYPLAADMAINPTIEEAMRPHVERAHP